ncbi:MAG: hypothetical protein FH748_03080 [Balneolaceae bacterium]|nr:hypothetical protein [Balneolaceae bacterium]
MTKNIETIELVLFKALADNTEEEVRSSLESLNPILSSYKGFVSRKIALSDSGQWMDLVHWESLEDAKHASDDIMKKEEALKAFSVIDQDTMQFLHLKPQSSFSE